MTRPMTLCHPHGLSMNPSERINTTKIEGTLKIPQVCYELCKQHCALPRAPGGQRETSEHLGTLHTRAVEVLEAGLRLMQ